MAAIQDDKIIAHKNGYPNVICSFPDSYEFSDVRFNLTSCGFGITLCEIIFFTLCLEKS